MTVRPTIWLVAAAIIAVDQATKQWALTALSNGEDINLIADWLTLRLVFNSGAAFSLGNDHTWILTIVAVVVTVGLVYYARRANGRPVEWLFGIGLGGAVGNLLDRIFRAPSVGEGHVIDMINYGNHFVGNIADIAIVGAASVAVIMGLMGKPLLTPESAAADEADDTRERADADAPGE